MRAVPTQIAARLPLAAALFAERGVEQTKIDEIAVECGIPKATLYYYFAGKEQILAFLLRDVLMRLGDEISIATAQPGTAAARLGGLIEAQLRVMAEQPDVCRALVGELGRAGRIPEIADAIRVSYYEPLAALLKEGGEDGSLGVPDNPQTAVTAVFGAVTITALSALFAGGHLDARVLAVQVLDLLMSGLAPREPDGRRSRGGGRSDQMRNQ